MWSEENCDLILRKHLEDPSLLSASVVKAITGGKISEHHSHKETKIEPPPKRDMMAERRRKE